MGLKSYKKKVLSNQISIDKCAPSLVRGLYLVSYEPKCVVVEEGLLRSEPRRNAISCKKFFFGTVFP